MLRHIVWGSRIRETILHATPFRENAEEKKKNICFLPGLWDASSLPAVVEKSEKSIFGNRSKMKQHFICYLIWARRFLVIEGSKSSLKLLICERFIHVFWSLGVILMAL